MPSARVLKIPIKRFRFCGVFFFVFIGPTDGECVVVVIGVVVWGHTPLPRQALWCRLAGWLRSVGYLTQNRTERTLEHTPPPDPRPAGPHPSCVAPSNLMIWLALVQLGSVRFVWWLVVAPVIGFCFSFSVLVLFLCGVRCSRIIKVIAFRCVREIESVSSWGKIK